MNIGVEGDPESVVKIESLGAGDYSSPFYILGGTKSNFHYAETKSQKRAICLPGTFDAEINIYGGRYELLADAAEGRLIQLFGGKNIFNIYGGEFISHYGGFPLNLAAGDASWNNAINIYGGLYYHDGKAEDSSNLPYLNMGGNGELNIFGGVFNLPNMSYPVQIINSAKINGYGGTFICSAQQRIASGSQFSNYGLTLINSITLSDIDMVNYRPVLKTGASVSLDPEVPGIKFTAMIPAHAMASLNAVKDAGTELSYGMLIAPSIKLANDLSILNFDTVRYLNLQNGSSYNDISVTETRTDQYGVTTFSAELTGIDEKYFTLDYSAAPYVKYIKNGQEVYLFANFSEANTRNMKDIATRALADHDEYDRGYNAKQLEALENYANAEYVENDASVTRVLSLNILAINLSAYSSYYPTIYSGQQLSDYDYGKRINYVKAMFDYAQPDVMLFQEFSGKNFWGASNAFNITGSNGKYTSPVFPGYEWISYMNRSEKLYENETGSNPFDSFAAYNFVVYNTAKFEHVESGTRFVSKSGSCVPSTEDLKYNNEDGSQSDYGDLGDFTYVVLQDSETGLKSIYASVHTYNKNEIQRYAYYLENLQAITSYLEGVSANHGNAPVVFGGDLNMQIYGDLFSEHYDHITNVANYRDAKVTGSDYGTNRDFGGAAFAAAGSSQHGTKIDYIFANGADTYGYEVLYGQVVNGAYDPYAVTGTGYDISDHLPIMTDVVIGKNQAYKAQTKENYTNPNAGEAAVLDAAGTAIVENRDIYFNHSGILPALSANSTSYGAQYVRADIVEDSVKGAVLRISATDETNNVDYGFKYSQVGFQPVLSGYKKLRITYKTELTYLPNGAKLQFVAKTQGSTLTSDISTSVSNGTWTTVEIDISQNTDKLKEVAVFGDYTATGLLAGDAIYIASIELIP